MAKAEATKTPETAAAAADPKTGELSVQQRNALALQEEEIDFSGEAGVGLENAAKDDFAIPFLAILQGLSPAVVDGKPGAAVGKIMNSVTEEITDDVVVVPCGFKRAFIEWAPRNKGGGYRGEHSPLDVESGKVGQKFTDDKGVERIGVKITNPDGGTQWNTLRDTRTHYVLVVKEDGTFAPAVISFAGTQNKKSKRWLSLIQGVQDRAPNGALFTPPSFSRSYHLFSVKESNDQGAWAGWSIASMGKVKSRELYEAAKAFNKLVMAGEVKVQHDEGV